MLQVLKIQENFEKYIIGLKKRGIKEAETKLKSVLSLNSQRKDIQTKLDKILFTSNQLAKTIGILLKEGKQQQANAAKEQTKQLKEESKKLQQKLNDIENTLESILIHIPNIPHADVPVGNNHEANTLIKQSDECISETADNKAHWELATTYNIIDFELGNKVSGSGFPFYLGQGARLVRSLINYFLDKAVADGYSEVHAPLFVNESSGFCTGQLPDKENQMYHLEKADLYAIPTAEVPITNMYRGVILSEDKLPIKKAGYTPCFRREAGSWGSHVRGLNRLHQFDKVEVVQIATPENSYQVLNEMLNYIESLVQSLDLPYRILRLCGGDLGFTASLTYDFEIFATGQKKWLEVSSVTNFESYQANRLKLRIKGANGKKFLAHTLNGSALAIPRIMAAILENNQAKDHIKMPKVLHKYLGFEEIKIA